MILRALAPGKVNLCLYLGRPREDGLHELVSLVESVSLADELELAPRGSDAGAGGGVSEVAGAPDEVVCPGVGGTNLAAAALRAYREATGWNAPAQLLSIRKRVPVAGGMGGGSGDAAAALRMAAHAAGRPDDPALESIAVALGADVPAQLRPGVSLVTGAGEDVQAIAALPAHGMLVVALPERLSTAAVFAEADRLGLGRSSSELERRRAALVSSLAAEEELPPDLLHNDLEPAARSLCPAIDGASRAVRATGADVVLVSGSGPTVFGIYRGADGGRAAAAAAADLAAALPRSVAAAPENADWAAPCLIDPLAGATESVAPAADPGAAPPAAGPPSR